MQTMFYSHNKGNTNIVYKLTFLTFEAANHTCRCKRKRRMSYGPNKLHQLDQALKLISNFTCLLIILLGRDGGGL
jgi:hypothetical protein